jgi:hypothetical protein
MAAVLRRRKMREGSVTGLNFQERATSYAGNQFPQDLTLSLRLLPRACPDLTRWITCSDPSKAAAWRIAEHFQ